MESHEMFVAKYDGKHFYAIFPITVFLLAISAFGMFGNVQIVWASIRNKTLRSTCNLLIAAAAFSDICHQFAHVILAVHLFTRRTFIPLVRCFLLQSVPVFWMNFGSFAVFSIGLDRLISVFFPIGYLVEPSRLYTNRFSYKQLKKAYTMVMLLVPVGFALAMTALAYWGAEQNRDVKVICVIPEVYHGPVKDTWINSILFVNTAILVVYASVWAVVKMRSGSSQSTAFIHTILSFVQGKIDRRIMRSLTIIMLLVLGGWFIASFVIAYGLANKEYRCAFVEQLALMGCDRWSLFRKQQHTTTVSVLTPSNSRPTNGGRSQCTTRRRE
ncbi:G-PROTEIN-RECEP-F1-2 domain-containing protein [Aphelenchoides fujianensis]|nr:G-PROTEIN-RECEP-F1-2 domain-containing protein [Aphelenchoides fujianensis]